MSPMKETLSDRNTFVTEVQPKNAPSSSRVTLIGMVMLVSDLQFWKAYLPMAVTSLPLITLGIVICPAVVVGTVGGGGFLLS